MTLEQAQEEILKLKEKVSTLTKDNDNYKKQIDEDKVKITDLQTYNQKLFLRVTSQPQQKKETEEFESKLLGDYAKLLDDDQLEYLKEIEGGL